MAHPPISRPGERIGGSTTARKRVWISKMKEDTFPAMVCEGVRVRRHPRESGDPEAMFGQSAY
jgi:hypothetical protein